MLLLLSICCGINEFWVNNSDQKIDDLMCDNGDEHDITLMVYYC